MLRELSVYDNVLLALQSGEAAWSLVWSRTRRRLDREIMQALDRFRLADRADDLAGELSHGEQQWLEIGMALALRPVLLLLDEPTAGLSPEETHRTGELVKRLNEAGTTLLVVEHDMAFVRQIATGVTVLHLGKVFAQVSIDEIVADPRVAEI